MIFGLKQVVLSSNSSLERAKQTNEPQILVVPDVVHGADVFTSGHIDTTRTNDSCCCGRKSNWHWLVSKFITGENNKKIEVLRSFNPGVWLHGRSLTVSLTRGCYRSHDSAAVSYDSSRCETALLFNSPRSFDPERILTASAPTQTAEEERGAWDPHQQPIKGITGFTSRRQVKFKGGERKSEVSLLTRSGEELF